MRVPGKFAKTLRTYYNKLHRSSKHRIEVDELDPISYLLLGILSADGNTRRAVSALKHLNDEMIDYNEMRVTPVPELAELISSHVKEADQKAQELVNALGWIFNKCDTMNLEYLKEQSHTEIKALFEKIPGCSDHARCLMLLLGFSIPICPVDGQMLACLIENDALPDEITSEEASNYIDRQLKAAEIRDFYLALKGEAEKSSGGSKKTDKNKSGKRKKATA